MTHALHRVNPLFRFISSATSSGCEEPCEVDGWGAHLECLVRPELIVLAHPGLKGDAKRSQGEIVVLPLPELLLTGPIEPFCSDPQIPDH